MSEHSTSNRSLGPILRYLTHTRPALIFVHGVVVLLLAPFVIAIEAWLQIPHAGFGDALRMGLEGGERYVMAEPGAGNPLRSALIWVLRLLSPMLGVLGYALPVWAAARLIADTLRDKARDPAPPTP
jgi:hypothetical protein